MMNRHLHKLIMAFTMAFGCLLSFLVTPNVGASADTGPKPSTTIEVIGLSDYPVHITLFSNQSAGPFHLITEAVFLQEYQDEEHLQDDVFMKFYQLGVGLANGYFYVDYYETLTEQNSSLTWMYYPPEDFIVVMYIPSLDRLIYSSDTYEHINFHTYYRLTIDEADLTHIENSTYTFASENLVYSSHFTIEILYFILRLFLTLIIEIGLAYLFKYRDKHTFFTILFTNVATSIILNVALSLILFFLGSWKYFFYLVIGEIFVVLIEATIYHFRFATLKEQGKISSIGRPILYAIAANVITALLSFIVQ